MDDVSFQHHRTIKTNTPHSQAGGRQGARVCLECGMSFRGRAASLTCHANWKMIPNANTHCVTHRPACCFTCPCNLLACLRPRDKPFFSSFSSRATKNNIGSAQVPPDLCHILTVPHCQIWTPPGLPRVLLVCNPTCLIYIQENISSANNTYLKITPDKIDPAMFVARFFKTPFLKRSSWIIWTCNLPGKTPIV